MSLVVQRYCKYCNSFKPEGLFKKNKNGTRYGQKCGDCFSKDKGIVEVGKLNYLAQLKSEGKWRCTDCKEIKPIIDFSKCKSNVNGFHSICKVCSNKRVRTYIVSSKNTLSDHYIKRRILDNIKIPAELITQEIIETVRLIYEAKRALIYTLDGIEFKTVMDMAKYASEKYGLNVTTITSRVGRYGRNTQEAILDKTTYRKTFSTKGTVTATNVITGEVLKFMGIKSAERELRISHSVIMRCIKNNEERRPYNNAKNMNVYKFTYSERR